MKAMMSFFIDSLFIGNIERIRMKLDNGAATKVIPLKPTTIKLEPEPRLHSSKTKSKDMVGTKWSTLVSAK